MILIPPCCASLSKTLSLFQKVKLSKLFAGRTPAAPRSIPDSEPDSCTAGNGFSVVVVVLVVVVVVVDAGGVVIAGLLRFN